MNFIRKPLNSLVKLQQMFRTAEIELGIENAIGITFETGVGVQSDILHVCRKLSFDTFFLGGGGGEGVLIDWWCIRKKNNKKNPKQTKNKTN